MVFLSFSYGFPMFSYGFPMVYQSDTTQQKSETSLGHHLVVRSTSCMKHFTRIKCFECFEQEKQTNLLALAQISMI